jgi:hypothetical protein
VSAIVVLFVATMVPVARATGATSPTVAILDVAFTVTNNVADAVNVNNDNPKTQLCPSGSSDGRRYVLPGRIVGPPSLLSGGSVTLFVHGATVGHLVVPGHDYWSQLAAMGHTVVTFTRLGYHPNGLGDPSGLNGLKDCAGAEAHVAHQVMTQLRSGTYTITKVDAGPTPVTPPAFDRVVLAAHSGGVADTELEEWEYHDADGLIVMGRPEDPTQDYPFLAPVFVAHISASIATCTLVAGNPAESGYAYLWNSKDDEIHDIFWRPDLNDPTVINEFKAAIEEEPCQAPSDATGSTSYTYPITQRPLPVLVLYGDQDQICPSARVVTDLLPGTCQDRARDRYLRRPNGAQYTTFFQVCLTQPCLTASGQPVHAGHELGLELPPAAQQFLDIVHNWLASRDF